MTPECLPAVSTALWVGCLLGRWLGRRQEARRLTGNERLDGCRGPHDVRGNWYVLVPEEYFYELVGPTGETE